MDYQDLWIEYKENGSKTAKDKLVTEYVSLVKNIAGRLYTSFHSQVEYDDIVGTGIIGLIDAVEKFDHKKQIKFETYATIRIRGAVVDHMRQNDWVPRSTRAKYRQWESTIERLQLEYGADLSDDIVAKEMGMSVEEYREHLGEITTYAMVSLEEKIGENPSFDVPSEDTSLQPYENLEQKEMRRLLAEALRNLPEKERQVLELYYYSELTYKEIAAVLSVTESRISQIHTKAIGKLRVALS